MSLSSAETARPKFLIIGWSPPPFNGMSTATQIVLNNTQGQFDTLFLDISDKRDLSNVGKFELGNILLAAKHGLQFLYLLFWKRPDVIYVPIAQHWLPFLRDCLFLVPARVANRKVIIHLHGGRFGQFWANSGRIMRSIIRFALGRARRVIVLGECLRNLFDEVVSRSRVIAIPNGIADYEAVPQNKIRNGRTLLYLGSLMKNKGVLELLSVMPAIRERFPDVRLILTGEWRNEEDRMAAMEIISNGCLEECVHCTGPIGVPQKYDIFRSADVFVMPTFYPNEGHPYAILEAMCAGLPVISTNIACIPETVIDGVTGFLVQPHDCEALTERITTLLEDSDLKSRMGMAARQRFLEHYTDVRFAEQLRSVFQQTSEEPYLR